MEVSSYTLPVSSCFLGVKVTFKNNRHATPKRSKRGRPKGGSSDVSKTHGESIAGQGALPHLPTDVSFKSFVLTALRDLHGDLGSTAYPLDVLSWDAITGEGRLRVPARSIVPIRAALSLVGSCGTVPCAVDVTEASPFLAGLACERYL